MNRDLYNSSGCKDPTAYMALRNIEKISTYFPLVFVSSPYAGDIEGNVERARKYCRFAFERGKIPIAPHLLFPQFLKEETERELAMHFNYVLLGKCQEVWVFGGCISPGMVKEIAVAKRRKMPIRYFTENFREVDAFETIHLK